MARCWCGEENCTHPWPSNYKPLGPPPLTHANGNVIVNVKGCGCDDGDDWCALVKSELVYMTHQIRNLTNEAHRLAQLIEAQTRTINRNTEEIVDQLEDLVAQVEAVEGVGQSVVTALNGLGEYIRTHTGIDPVVRQQIAERIASLTQRMSDAVQANPVPPAAPTA